MRVINANFGQGNYLWPECRERSTVATTEDERLREAFLAGDRSRYIQICQESLRTAAGNIPPVPVASRWFNIGEILATTSGDLWIHQDGEFLWWTISQPQPASAELRPAQDPEYPGHQVFAIHKPAMRWSNQTKGGATLNLQSLHPKARGFLFNESTLVALSESNANYIRALIDGDDLTHWHNQASWVEKLASSKHGTTYLVDAREKSVIGMVTTAIETVKGANGQLVERRVKLKTLGFESEPEFQQYVRNLIRDQEGYCAISGLQLQYATLADDKELLASLDRIDSAGHYARGNLQVVCRFINRWKSDDDAGNFSRLLQLIRATSGGA